MKTLRTLILTAALNVAIPAPWATAQIFLSSTGGESVESADLDGGNPRTLIDMNVFLGNDFYRLGAIAVSGDTLFWGFPSRPNFIYASDLDGSNPRELINLRDIEDNNHSVRGLVVVEDQLFWTDNSRGAIYAAGVDGSNPREVVKMFRVFGPGADGYELTGLAASDGHLYWGDSVNDTVYTARVDGSNPRVLFRLGALFGNGVDYRPIGIAISGSRLYLSDWERGIYAVNVDGGNPTHLVDRAATNGTSRFGPHGLAVLDSQIYWTDTDQAAVYTAGLDGSDPRKLFDTPSSQPSWIAVAAPPEFNPWLLNIRKATELRWDTRLGVNYLIQHSSDGEGWLDDSSPIAGTGSQMSVLRQMGLEQQDYRVVVRASLMGESINVSGFAMTPSSATIDSEIEFQGIFGSLFFDFDGSQLTITQNPDQPTGGWSNAGLNVFSGFDAAIVDVSIAENEGFEGAIVDNFSFSEHSITFDFDPLTRAGTRLVFDIRTAADSPEETLVSPLDILPATELHWDSRTDVSYQIRRSADLNTWFDDGAAILGSGSELSALRRIDSERGYYRLDFPGSSIGAVTRLEPGTPLMASFETSTTGSTSGIGDGGDTDNLPWSVTGDRGVALESTLPNPPGSPGRCLLANSGALHFRSQKIDLRAVSNEEVIVRVDLRTYEDNGISDWEPDDSIEAWIEGSEDGINFSRFAAGVGTVIPFTSGDASSVTNDPNHPDAEDLERLQMPNGAYTTFSSADNPPIPPEIQFIRIYVSATTGATNERIFVDNVMVSAGGP